MNKHLLSRTPTERRGDGLAGISFEQLETFRGIVRAGGFSRAADLLFLTQPAISQRVQHLEQALGVPLFQRDGNRRKLRLTAAGERVLLFTDEMVNRLQQLRMDIEDWSLVGQRETITIACSATPARHILPNLLAAFYQQHPCVQVSLVQTSLPEVSGIIRAGKAEFGMVMGRSVDDGFRSTLLVRDRLVLVASPDYPYPPDFQKVQDGIRRHPFVLAAADNEIRGITEKWAASYRLDLDVVAETGSVEFAKETAMRGLALCIVPMIAVVDEVRDGRLRILAAPGLPQDWYYYLISNAERALSPAAQCLIKIAGEGTAVGVLS